jgi:citrate synthase
LGGGGCGLCFGGAVEAAARMMQKIFDSEFDMAVDKIKGNQATIN